MLKANTTEKDISNLCKEAIKYGFYSVCIPPYFIDHALKIIEGSEVKLCTVIGFPLGYQLTSSKVDEIKRVEESGAEEVDVVINVAAIKSGNWDYVENEMESLSTTASIKGLVIKIIFETCYLTRNEIIKLCNLCVKYDVNFVKTSTGFGRTGADEKIVKLMKKTVGDKVKVKASGGIRTYSDAMRMIEAGAERIGASAGIDIIKGK